MKLKSRYLFIAMGLVGFHAPAFSETLMQIYQQASKHDPIILQAKATNAAEQAGIGVSRANLLPTINVNLKTTGTQRKISDTSTNTSSMTPAAGITLDQTIFNMSDWQGYSMAKLSAQQADIVYLNAQQQLIIRVTRAYFDALYKSDLLELRKAESETLERELQQTKQKFTVGLVTVASVHEAQASFDSSIAGIIKANNNLMNSYEALREITGIEYTELARLNLKTFDAKLPEPGTIAAWIDLAENNSPSLIQAKFAKQISFKNLSKEQSGHYPTLALSASYNNQLAGTSTTNNTQIETSQQSTSTLDLTLSIPITNGFRTYSSAEQKRFQYVAASQKLVQTHRRLTKDIRNDFNNIQALISTIKAQQQAVVSATSALSAIRAGFDVGTKTIIDVLTSTKALFKAKSDLAKSRFDYIKAQLQLKADAGTLNEADLNSIEKGLQQLQS